MNANRITPKDKYFSIEELLELSNNQKSEMKSKFLKATYSGEPAIVGHYPSRQVKMVIARLNMEETALVVIPAHLTNILDVPSTQKSISAKGIAGFSKLKSHVEKVEINEVEISLDSLLTELAVRPTVLKSITVLHEEGLDFGGGLIITAESKSIFGVNEVRKFPITDILNPDESPSFVINLEGENDVITPTTEIKICGLGSATKVTLLIDFNESYGVFD